MIAKLLKRDLQLTIARSGDFLNNFAFFIALIVIYNFSFAENLKQDHFLASGVIFVSLIFAINLNSVPFLKEDFNDGSIKQYYIYGAGFGEIIIAKFLIFLIQNLPIILMSIIAGLMFGFSKAEIYFLVGVIALVLPILVILSFLHEILTLPISGKTSLVFVLTFPLLIPFLILTMIAFENYFVGNQGQISKQIETIIYLDLIFLPIFFIIAKTALKSIVRI